MKITVDKNLCPQNHKCPSTKVCPVGAIQQSGNGLPTIDDEKCIKCKKCVMFCPMRAIQAE
ncbi:MAG: 4Fe-4S binding protein [Clostridia bacterium]|nr:4Fe-4S binding protein [Clostridia bacterium]